MGVHVRPIGDLQQDVVQPIHQFQVERQLGSGSLNPGLASADPRLIPGKSRGHDGDENCDETEIYSTVDHLSSPERRDIWCSDAPMSDVAVQAIGPVAV